MEYLDFLILQIIAHLLADYFLQTDHHATEKNQSGFRSRFLKWHILIVFLSAWLLSFQFWFFTGSLVLGCTHWLSDGIKPVFNKTGKLKKYLFFVDQLIHILFIIVITALYYHIAGINAVIDYTLSTEQLLIITAYAFCAKPANILIREIIKVFNIQITKDEQEEPGLPNAGKLIGITERWLVLTFILINQFEAVGFLIAAKSILRFREDSVIKTEYVLIGTLLSFGIAIVLGILPGLIEGTTA